MNFLYIVIGFGLLIYGGNWLLKSAVSISLRLQVPKIVIGMTVVSFATSAPELIVSIKSALNGFSDLAIGNVMGSNIANLGLVLGITLLVARIDVQRTFYNTDWPIMMLATTLMSFFVFNDSVVTRAEGIILFLTLLFFLFYLFRFQKESVTVDEPGNDDVLTKPKTLLYLLIGSVGLWAGSELLIHGATSLAKDFGVSERLIAVTIVSVGTSIPELAASLLAVIKKEKGISLGNLIGSNMFNILAVMGVTSIITPISVIDTRLLTNDIYWVIGISFLILPLVFIPKNLRLDWKDGIVLLICYATFIYTTT